MKNVNTLFFCITISISKHERNTKTKESMTKSKLSHVAVKL